MAKENYVFITGVLVQPPKFVQDREGNLTEAVFPLRTIRRGPYDKAGSFDPKYDVPTLRTKDPRLINMATGFQQDDVIEAKCVLVTNNARRTYTCPHCGARFVRSVFLTYLSPVSLSVRNRCGSETEASHILNDMDVAENSNVLKVIGRVSNEDGPRYHVNEATGKRSCTFQIAVNRKFMLYGAERLFGVKSDGNDDELNRRINDNRSDYPWVVSYDKVADENAKYLHQGSLVFIDGYFHSRSYTKTLTCENPECGRDFETSGMSLTITPYDMEYLEDCDIPDIKNDDLDRIDDLTDDEADMG